MEFSLELETTGEFVRRGTRGGFNGGARAGLRSPADRVANEKLGSDHGRVVVLGYVYGHLLHLRSGRVYETFRVILGCFTGYFRGCC